MEYKISFCTTCMNRLHHLKETLPQNILDNQNYRNLEFILLDYNSEDELSDYVLQNLNEHLISGRLTYYRTTNPMFYNMSHSRNVAFKVASGDILCNIDADNFTGQNFAHYVNEMFNKKPKIFLSTHINSPNIKNDVLGRICVKREDFLAIGGYEERMKHYGFDDFDFAYRLELSGLEKMGITDERYLNAIVHTNKERLANGIDDQSFDSLLIKYQSPYESELVLMFKDNTYKRGRMVNTNLYNAASTDTVKVSTKYDFSILEKQWVEGTWEKIDSTLTLSNNGHQEHLFSYLSNNSYIRPSLDGVHVYYQIMNEFLIEEVLFFYHQLSNRIIMEDNLEAKKVRANSDGFGREKLFKNFDTENPLIL